MCTVTWLHDDGLTLLMNRDELFSRGEALLPRIHERGGVRVLAPIDTDAGGSWIAANERGLVVCLLNRYPVRVTGSSAAARAVIGDRTSRGQLVLELSDAPDLDHLLARIRGAELGRFRPFTLVALDGSGGATLVAWDTASLQISDATQPVTSSSFDEERVVASRREAYEQIVGAEPTVDRLREYHRSHLPERGAYSVCAHREDGGTRSLTEVRVSTRDVTMAHTVGPPCSVASPLANRYGFVMPIHSSTRRIFVSQYPHSWDPGSSSYV
jgi:hypothetical protein